MTIDRFMEVHPELVLASESPVGPSDDGIKELIDLQDAFLQMTDLHEKDSLGLEALWCALDELDIPLGKFADALRGGVAEWSK